MNLKAFHIKLFFKQLFVFVLFLGVISQSLSKAVSLIIDSNYELVVLDLEDNSEEEQQQEDDTKNQKTQILFVYTSNSFSNTNETNLISRSENLTDTISREIHSPPPDFI